MLDKALQEQLLDIAEASIRHGIGYGRPLSVSLKDYPHNLGEPGASFVTLNRDGQLRGCIGSLSPHRALAEDVAENAYAAAFSDPRFPPLREEELAGLDIHISILSAAEPMCFSSESELLQQLQPGVDGLIMEEGFRRGTFLPSVWEQLPSPELFLRHLKQKAGLPSDYWSDSLRVSRYTTHSFGRQIPS
jgi:AmmeMemoRadiSam system protein A